MRYLADVLLVAWGGVAARKFRTGLIALGPFLGVVAIVAILGVSRSAKAQAREAIRELGADLVVVEAGGAISDGTSGLPTEAVERVRRVPGVESVAALAFLDGVAVSPTAATAAQSIDTAVIRVYTSDASLVRLLAAPVRHGRFLNTTDDAGRPVAVAGAGAARRLGLLPGEMRSILVGGQVVGVVGVLEHLSLLPDLDDAMFVASSYGATLVHDVGPTQLLVKTDESAANTVANLLTAAITYGVGEVPSVRVPTQLLAARAEVDRTFEVTVIAMGLLSLAIGRPRYSQCVDDLCVAAGRRNRHPACARPHPICSWAAIPCRIGLRWRDRRSRWCHDGGGYSVSRGSAQRLAGLARSACGRCKPVHRTRCLVVGGCPPGVARVSFGTTCHPARELSQWTGISFEASIVPRHRRRHTNTQRLRTARSHRPIAAPL